MSGGPADQCWTRPVVENISKTTESITQIAQALRDACNNMLEHGYEVLVNKYVPVVLGL